MTFTQQYLEETQKVTAGLNAAHIEKVVDELAKVRERGGRLFILGVGGSAANASAKIYCYFGQSIPSTTKNKQNKQNQQSPFSSIYNNK